MGKPFLFSYFDHPDETNGIICTFEWYWQWLVFGFFKHGFSGRESHHSSNESYMDRNKLDKNTMNTKK